MSRSLLMAKNLPIDVLKELLKKWEDRAKGRLLREQPTLMLDDVEAVRAASSIAKAANKEFLVHALRWYAFVLEGREKLTLEAAEVRADQEIAYERFRQRAQAIRAVAGGLHQNKVGPGEEEEYRFQLRDIELSIRLRSYQ